MRRTRFALLSAGVGLLLAVFTGMHAWAAETAPTGAMTSNGATPDSTTLDCADSPFGSAARFIQHVEPLQLMRAQGFDKFDEYRGPVGSSETDPYIQVYRSNLLTASFVGTLERAINVDLNGDGRDEVVAAYSMGGGVVGLGVYERTDGFSPSAQLIDTWTFNGGMADGSLDLVAGDFAGATNRQQDLAVVWRGASGGMRLVVLTGSTNGGIAQADNAFAGQWFTQTGYQFNRVTKGDFLLDGRDQIMLVSYATNHVLDYDLLEFNTPNPVALPVASGSTAIGSKHMSNPISAFTYGATTYVNDSVQGLDADGGDVVDTAAAELVVHVQYATHGLGSAGTDHATIISQRLVHFTVTHSSPTLPSSPITSITPTNDHDRVAQQNVGFAGGSPSPEGFDATVADMDGQQKAEIVLAASSSTAFAGFSGPLRVQGSKARTVLKAGFTWQANGNGIHFINTSTGADPTRQDRYVWNFGDGHGNVANSQDTFDYSFPNSTAYAVILTVKDALGGSSSIQYTVTTGGSASGGAVQAYTYVIDDPVYSADLPITGLNGFGSASLLRVAVGDMNGYGMPEVMTVARQYQSGSGNYPRMVRSRWHLTEAGTPASFAGVHTFEDRSEYASLTAMSLVPGDFDGNSIQLTLGDDCRRVTDAVLRTLIWQPPYFKLLQPDGMGANFGQSNSSSYSSEQSTGSYTGNSISGFVGVDAGLSVFGADVFESQLHFTAGHAWQSEKGSNHGTENDYTDDTGFSQNDTGEALVRKESASSDCYSYNVVRYGGAVPGSAMRMCSPVPSGRTLENDNADDWNSLASSGQTTPPFAPQPQWVPLQRDWASLALFRPVAAVGPTAIDAAKATDGLFDSATDMAVAATKPYIEIDLGTVRDISAIRVFPAAGKVKDLWGFRVYASATPFTSGGNVPSGAAVTSFQQGSGENDAVYDRWNIWALDPNTRAPLQARYIRLQHPGGPVFLRVAEMQVFGDAHAEPPAYPDAVCDANTNDGFFLAKVWNPVAHVYANIQVRGALEWSGASDGIDTGIAGCSNALTNLAANPPERGVRSNGIWQDQKIGSGGPNSGTSWDLSDSSNSSLGSYSSYDSSTSLGVEFSLAAGFGVKLAVGGAYEHTLGVTKEYTSSMSWGQGLAVGGSISGFTDTGMANVCGYYPRPYAYRLTERSSLGFEHDLYVTDYAVRQVGRSGTWQRDAVPGSAADASVCGSSGDVIFADGFD